MNIAIIPARGGSKRIPRKNIKDFCGKPMIAYSIEAAIASDCFDRVFVSTDDYEISEIAKAYGAEVPFMRPENLSDDYATTVDVIQHAIKALNIESDDNVCCIYATAPFITPFYLKQGLSCLLDNKIDYAFSATEFSFPIQRAFKFNSNNRVEMFQPQYCNTRSQDLKKAYHDAGQFYWGKSNAFLSGSPIFSLNSIPVILPIMHVQDIDTDSDWLVAEFKFNMLNININE